MIFVTYEDRPDCLIGLKILVRSLARHLPDARIRVWCPVGNPAFDAFRIWLGQQPNALPSPQQALPGTGWNVKPAVLLHELERGAGEAIWIDADIIVGADPRPLLAADDRTLLATEGMRWDESPRGTAQRTRAFGLPVGREIEGIVSSSIVRVTPAHIGLVREWARLLQSPEYVQWQDKPFWSRPSHALGDQDVLMALLGAAEFSWIPIRYIHTGRGIAHCFFSVGYTTTERLRNSFRGPPPFVHAPSPVKPWSPSPALSVEVSPYTWVAARYAHELEEPMDWTRPRSRAAKLLHLAFLGEPNLRGIPLAAVREARLYLDKGLGRLRRRAS